MPHIDLNCDLGESFGAYTIGMDEKVIPFITSANVACGFHAGDPLVMQRTVALCKQSGAAVGAHPGFPDLQGFGRRQMKLTPAEAKACVQYQIGALKAFCDAAGVPLQHVKPHGALYNMAGKDRALADAICAAVKESAPARCCWRFPAARWSRRPRPSACRLPTRCLPTAATARMAALCPAEPPVP